MSYVRATRRNPDRQRPRVGPGYQAELPCKMDPGQLVRDGLSNPYLRGSSEIPTVRVENHDSRRSNDREDRTSIDCTSKAWTVDEREGFVLGLYIFKKNFALVKKFVGTKEMGDLLRFYFGEFYGSYDYRLWAECRKSTGRSRRFYGKRLFSKWRGDMILSRLSSLVGQDLRAMLIQSSARFICRRLSFEEYVFELKGIVGIPALVTAIRVGKGINDLTQNERKPGKCTETAASVNHASLNLPDIFDTLKKHSKLSKSLSRELFFKTVWPHLQVRGWHSKRLENHNEFGLKNPTVFLVKGKRKFSMRLATGKHYFNSIKAVFYEVASTPQILEDSMLYTVLDTALVDEPEICRYRDLHSAKIYPIEELEASNSEGNGIENGTCIDSPKLVEEKSSSQCSLTNEPCVVSCSEDAVEMSSVNNDSYRTRKPFDLNLPYVPTDSESEESTEKDIDIRQEKGNSDGDLEMAPVNDVYAMRKSFDLNVSYVPTYSGSDQYHENAESGTDARQENDNSGIESSRRKSVRSRATAKRVLEAFETDLFSSKKRKKRVQ